MTTNTNDKTEVPMWTDVPLDMHPGSLGPYAKTLDAEGSPGQGAFRTAREAFADAYRAFKKINDAEKAVQPKNPPRRGSRAPELPSVVTPELIEGVEKSQKRALPEFQKRYEHCAKVYEQLQKRVTEAVTDEQRNTPSGIAHEQAILAHVKALPEGERMSFLDAAIKDEDRVTISAVLHARHYLSGLTKEQHVTWKERAEVVLSEDKAALSAMEKMLADMRKVGEMLKGRHDKILTRRNDVAVQERMKNYLAIKALREE